MHLKISFFSSSNCYHSTKYRHSFVWSGSQKLVKKYLFLPVALPNEALRWNSTTLNSPSGITANSWQWSTDSDDGRKHVWQNKRFSSPQPCGGGISPFSHSATKCSPLVTLKNQGSSFSTCYVCSIYEKRWWSFPDELEWVPHSLQRQSSAGWQRVMALWVSKMCISRGTKVCRNVNEKFLHTFGFGRPLLGKHVPCRFIVVVVM